MAKVYGAQTSFAGGELSPSLYARTDLAQYHIGAKTLENFIVLPQGSIIKRPPLKGIGNGHHLDEKQGLIIPFVYSQDMSYVLYFLYKQMAIYEADGECVESVPIPYKTKDFADLKYLQCGKVMYFFHPDYWPRMVTFDPLPVDEATLIGTGGVIGQYFIPVKFKNGPFESINTDPGRKVEIKNGYLIPTGFNISDVADWSMSLGGLFYIETQIKSWSDDFDLNDEQWHEVTGVFGAFTYRTSGKWRGVLNVQRKTPDDANWEDFKSYTSEKDAEENFSYSGTVEEYANQYRFKFTKPTDVKAGNLKLTFSYDGGVIPRIFRITGFLTNGRATVVPMDGLGNNAPLTDAWAEGAFGTKHGYPRCGVLHQNRLILGGTKHNPQGIWMSKPASWHDFGTSIPAKDDDAIHITIASKEVNDVLDFASLSDLLVFTKGGEWTIRAGNKTDVFTPSSITATPSNYRGSSTLSPLTVGDTVLFLHRNRERIYSIGYSLDVDGYATQDLTILAEHIFNGNKIVSWTYQENPWSLIWCVLEDGTCAALTFQKEHKVLAWSRHVFSNLYGTGKVLSVCSVPGKDEDRLFFVVDTKQNDVVWIERMNKQGDYEHSNSANPVRSIFESLDLEVGGGGGTIQGRYKHIPAMTLRLLNTKTLKGCVVTEDTAANPVLDEMHFPLQNNPGAYSNGLFSGDVRFVPQGGVGRTCRIRLEHDDASPVQILGIFPEIVIEDEEVSLSNGGQS